jgi:hypothetical protein
MLTPDSPRFLKAKFYSDLISNFEFLNIHEKRAIENRRAL